MLLARSRRELAEALAQPYGVHGHRDRVLLRELD